MHACRKRHVYLSVVHDRHQYSWNVGLAINEIGALITRHTYMVVPANVWDSLFGTDLLDVNATEWAGAVAAG